MPRILRVMVGSRLSRLLSLALLGVAPFAMANDLTLGGGRRAGMGGAGLALPIDVVNNYQFNPSLLAYHNRTFSFQVPEFSLRFDGLDLDELRDYFGDFDQGGLDLDRLAEFGRRFGGSRKDVAATASAGILINKFALVGMGEAQAATLPNATLQNAIRAGATNPPVGAQLDAYGIATVGYGLGYGNTVKIGDQKVSLGAIGRFYRTYYAHQIARYDGTTNAIVGGAADVRGRDSINETGFGLDFGALYQIPNAGETYAALTVDHLINPRIRFDRQLPNSSVIRRDNLNPFRTAYNVGFGTVVKGKALFALDFIDLGNRAGRAETAVGAEYRVTRGFAVRAGYNTRTAFTFGVELAGFNIAFVGNRPTATVGFRF